MVFIGFSTRGSVISDQTTMKELCQKAKDPQYVPNVFMFEKTELDKEIVHKDDVIMTFGICHEEVSKKGWFPNLYGGSKEPEFKSPTFVKPFYALPSYSAQYLYKRVFG